MYIKSLIKGRDVKIDHVVLISRVFDLGLQLFTALYNYS